MEQKLKTPINLQNLDFYFDGIVRDQLDQHKISKKSQDIMRLKDRLYLLPQEEFNAAVKTLETIISHESSGERHPLAKGGLRTPTNPLAGLELYEQIRGSGQERLDSSSKVAGL